MSLQIMESVLFSGVMPFRRHTFSMALLLVQSHAMPYNVSVGIIMIPPFSRVSVISCNCLSDGLSFQIFRVSMSMPLPSVSFKFTIFVSNIKKNK